MHAKGKGWGNPKTSRIPSQAVKGIMWPALVRKFVGPHPGFPSPCKVLVSVSSLGSSTPGWPYKFPPQFSFSSQFPFPIFAFLSISALHCIVTRESLCGSTLINIYIYMYMHVTYICVHTYYMASLTSLHTHNYNIWDIWSSDMILNIDIFFHLKNFY